MSQTTENREAGRPSAEELGLLLARAERGDQTEARNTPDLRKCFTRASPLWISTGASRTPLARLYSRRPQQLNCPGRIPRPASGSGRTGLVAPRQLIRRP